MITLTRRKHSVYIVSVAILSILSLVIVCTSFGTEYWINGFAYPTTNNGPKYSKVNYGLFKGTIIRRSVDRPCTYDLYFTCIWNENSCAWSCADDRYSREKEVQRLISGKKPNFDCVPIINSWNSEGTNCSTEAQTTVDLRDNTYKRIFTNSQLWLWTIIFISILTIALLISVVLSIINCMSSPIKKYFNVHGICRINEFSLGANFCVLVLYGICYDICIKENIAILDTFSGDYASRAHLGYSYWILHASLVFEAVGIFLIARREKIVTTERAEMKIDAAIDIPESGVLYD